MHLKQGGDTFPECDRQWIAQYAASIERVGGVNWRHAFLEPLSLRGYAFSLKTIPSLTPGFAERTYPALETLLLERAAPAEQALLMNQLSVLFFDAVTLQNWPMAFRFAFVRILQLRAIAIADARADLRAPTGASSSSPQPFFILRNHRSAFPQLPAELRTALHSVSYGTNPMETVCRQALGIELLPCSLAGVCAVNPLFTVNSIRHAKRHKPVVQVPSLIFKVLPLPLSPFVSTRTPQPPL
jgi:hypothetical protein